MDSPDLLWEEEARAVILDVQAHVKEIGISPILHSTNSRVYLNLTTLECQPFTVELSSAGFRTVAKKYNSIDDETGTYFDTPYALLTVLSPAFPGSFADLLRRKLEGINNDHGSCSGE
uniref:GSK3-beta interaction protein n=1 Tax=Lygus hesperus TaxID=30085 RepID=A0A146MFQ1_LYGHE